MKPSNSSSPHSLPEILGYQIFEQLYLGSRTIVYRGQQQATQRPVVIKVLRNNYPSFSELVQFRNQYTIAKNLPIAGIVRPQSLETLGSGYALVMEDWSGVALSRYLEQYNLHWSQSVDIAVQLCDILHELAQHRVVHKDIKPANILINPDLKQVKLIDFSISSLLPKENQENQSPHNLEGTLAYLAPEQTGRMNRGIDYRSDFYALGVTLYQLLTGSVPFTADEPMELVHCHIAKMATPVHQVNPEVPEIVSEIVVKLMAKNAEDRYQSALGLKYDLERCLQQWKQTGAVAGFGLGERDLSDRFNIPEKLYGRDTEVQTLLEAFERVANGASELMLVAGFSGIGKTAVVNEVHKPIVRQRGYFIKGKFDQFNRNIPLSAFVQALRDLMGQLLAESDLQLAQWKTQILAAVGENGQVLIEVIPELEQIIGKQPPATELSGSAAQNRFNLLFQKFIEVFTTAEHPLVVFLDDLQWADSASLQLIKLLMSDNGYLLMLGAYRDNEVSPTHPFILTVEELKKAEITVNTITLAPLDFADVNQLIADTLSCLIALVEPLTELVMQKTQGNPFFLTQFLKALHEDGLIAFNLEQRYWECDISKVNTLSLTDDVVEFMAQQLQKLPDETQEVLKLAACVGNQFDLHTLVIVSERSSIDAATALWKALQEGLILPTSQVYKFFQGAENSQVENVNPTYRFLHDRVQQAAYSLIPETQRQQTHLRIGRLLQHNQAEYLFEILNHFGLSLALITDPIEQRSLIQLNLAGCQQAKASTAYSSATQYANIAMDLLPPASWQTDRPLALQVHEAAAEAFYLNVEFAAAVALIETVLQQADQPIDCIKSYELLVQIYTAQGEQLKAVETGLSALTELGMPLVECSNWQANLPQLPRIDQLDSQPQMTDPVYLAALTILSKITPATHHVKPELFPSVVMTMVDLCDRGGYSELAAYAYGVYGLLLCAAIGDLDAAHRSGQVSLALLEQCQTQAFRAKVNMLVAVFTCACKDSGDMTLPLLTQGIEVGLSVGDMEYVSYCVMGYLGHLFLIGKPLRLIEESERNHLPILEQFKQEHAIEKSKIWLRVTDEMIGSDSIADSTSDAEILAHFENTHNHQCLFGLHLAKLISDYIFGKYALALDHANDALKSEDAAFGILLTSAHTFYYSLALLALMTPQQSQSDRQVGLEQVMVNQEKMRHLAHHAPSNYQHKYILVEAECHRVLGNQAEAIALYDQAISGAKANGFIQEEALANELAAKFYLNWGKEKVAAGYMQEAYYGYARWGAKAKTDQLEQHYPDLLRPILQQTAQSFNPMETLASIASPNFSIHTSTSRSSTSINEALDFATIIKASQTLASTIQLDELLHQLAQIILQHSGAGRFVLIMPNSLGEWQVQLIATPETIETELAPLDEHPDLPLKLIHYVKNTQEVVVIDDLKTDLPVLDAYLLERQPKSVLCMPILHQGKLLGIVDLKNRSTRGVFTRDRILLLSFLCTQAAISLENARLYQTLQQSETKFRAFVENVNDLIYAVTPESTFIYLSPQFKDMWGYEVDEFLHQSFVPLVHPDDQAEVFASLQRSVEIGEKVSDVEFRTKHQNGSWFWITCNHSPIKDQQGQVIGIQGIARDISDRKQAEAQLRENELFLRNIYEGVGQGICVVDVTPTKDFRFVGWNPSIEKLTGICIADVINKNPEALLGEEYGATVRQNYQRCLAVGTTISYEEMLPFEGRDIWWLTTLNPLRNEQNRIYRIIVTTIDITDRKRAERYLLVQYTITQILAGADSLAVAASQVVETLCTNLGWSLGELWMIDPTTQTLKLSQTWHCPSSELAQFIASSQTSEFAQDIGLPGKSWAVASPVWIIDVCQNPQFLRRDLAVQANLHTAVGFPIQNAQTTQGVLTLFTHQTLQPDDDFLEMLISIGRQIGQFIDRTTAQSQTRQKKQELEQALQQLEHSQLQTVQSEKMASLGNLVAGVAHEINNPIGFLNGSINNAKDYIKDLLEYTQLYQQHHPNPAIPIQEFAEDIDLEFLREDLPKLLNSMQGATDRIKGISTSLRTFSRADTEHPVTANIHEGIDSTILILKYRLKANEHRPDIQVVTEYGDIPQIQCFPGQLNQVFMNILANAIDMFDEMAQTQSLKELTANPQTITIQTERTGDQVVIRIRDNGKGMDEATCSKIFDHLFTTKAVGKGTGLGLAIARQIVVEKHGGAIKVDSQVGKGTEFRITLFLKQNGQGK
ncbi:MAG: AAA family ATPase [Goleter apudmare HA4340-LM2]|jgi:PAS domain S-box-containing protein|nr:AAA family ATPase [Goleter apudmare HA4340-LM2]